PRIHAAVAFGSVPAGARQRQHPGVRQLPQYLRDRIRAGARAGPAHPAANHLVQTQRATLYHGTAPDREYRVHYLGVQQYAGARGQVDVRLREVEGNRRRQTIAQPVADSMHAALGAPDGESSLAETGATARTDRDVVDEAGRPDSRLLSRHRHDGGGRDSTGQALGGNRARRGIYRDRQEAARRQRVESRESFSGRRPDAPRSTRAESRLRRFDVSQFDPAESP